MKMNNPSPFGYFLGKRKKSNKAFTLVELIVVITILAILGTIAFLSFQGYSRDARDSVRISDLSNIHKQLELMIVKSSTIYIPENKVDITASGTVILYQGEMGQDTLNKLKINNGGLDPVDQTPYTYSTTKNLKQYELMGFLETGNKISFQVPSPGRGGLGRGLFPQANAISNLINRFPITKGDSIGIILDPTTNSPIQSTGTGVDIVNTNTNYKVYLDNSSSGSISGTGINLMPILSAGYKFKSCNEIIKRYGYGIPDGIYKINPNGTLGFDVYCDMATDGGGWTRVLDTNGNFITKIKIEKSDYYLDKNNYSYLYSMKNIKSNNGNYEFLVRGYKLTNTRWLQFTQTNAYNKDPHNNSFNNINGTFSYPSGFLTKWRGLAFGTYGTTIMKNGCASLAMSSGIISNRTTCLIAFGNYFGVGPWDFSINKLERITIFQR